jgi:hypothetical protein
MNVCTSGSDPTNSFKLHIARQLKPLSRQSASFTTPTVQDTTKFTQLGRQAATQFARVATSTAELWKRSIEEYLGARRDSQNANKLSPPFLRLGVSVRFGIRAHSARATLAIRWHVLLQSLRCQLVAACSKTSLGEMCRHSYRLIPVSKRKTCLLLVILIDPELSDSLFVLRGARIP